MRFVAGAICFLIAVGFQLKMIVIFRKMMDDVNGVLPPESRIGEFGVSLDRGKVIKYHRMLFPSSKLTKRLYTLSMCCFLSFITCLAFVIRIQN